MERMYEAYSKNELLWYLDNDIFFRFFLKIDLMEICSYKAN